MDSPVPAYLDAASGEPLHPAARDVLDAAIARGYGDPRRLHAAARDARLMLDNARAAVAEALGVRRDEVLFTASGSEAVHLGVLGLLAGAARLGDRLLATAVEHSAVLQAGAWHQRHGGSFSTIPVDALGRVVLPLPAEEATVVAVQQANHEVGTLQPLADLDLGVDQQLFVDACAAGGRIGLPPRWDAAALSAHKWGGPVGLGVLLVRRSARWTHPFVSDNHYERALLGENVPLALAAAAALQAVVAERDEVASRQRLLVDRIRASVGGLPGAIVLGDPVDRLPHLVTFCLPDVDGESVVGELDRRGFQVASGSACTASTLEPSHVLVAMGAPTEGNIRVSLSRTTTADQVDAFLAVLPQAIEAARGA